MATSQGKAPIPDREATSRDRPTAGRRRAAHALATVTGVLMLAQSATGMLFFRLYRDHGFALDAWRVNDLVTLFVAVPLMFVSLAFALRGSLRGLLLLLGAVQYAFYNYAFYLFGAALNVHFLLYVALFVVSGLALIAGFAALDAPTIGKSFLPKTPAKAVAFYMAVWAATLGVAWVSQSLFFAFSGRVPGLGEEPFRLVAALDLSLVVVPVAIAATWLWVRRTWGFITAIVFNVNGAVYGLVLSIGSLSGGPVASGGGDGLLGLWAFLTLGSLASLVTLLAHVRPAE